MWVALSLLSAAGSAGTGLSLKRTLGWGGPIASTVAYRAVAGVLLLVAALLVGPAGRLGADYAVAVGLVIPFEVVGTVAFALALRAGDVSLVSPLFGLLPVTVTLAGAVFLGERPTPAALAGVALVAAGVYGLGLDGSRSPLAPLRFLARAPAGRWAALSVLSWSATAVIHKVGIAASGPMPWAATLALGSAVSIGLVAPLLPADVRGEAAPRRGAGGLWARGVVVCGALFTVQQIGLQLALAAAPVGYVTALTATSIAMGVLGGVLLLGEREAIRQRIAGGLVVSTGAALVALYG